MRVALLTVHLHIPWSFSLKDKRAVISSLANKLRNKFNISVSEIDQQDKHQVATIGITYIAANTALGDSIAETIIAFIETNTDAEITKNEIQYL